MAGLARETPSGAPNLVVHREPQAPAAAGDKGSLGDTALMDAVYIIGGCWVALFLLFFSLRGHNV